MTTQEEDFDNRFSYHAPDDEARMRHEALRTTARHMAGILGILPDSREKSLALTNLEQAMFWGNAAVARINDDGTRR